jgi:hypothetical protein
MKKPRGRPAKPKEAITSLSNIVITSTDAAALIGKSRNWLAKLVTDGFIKKAGQNFRPIDVSTGYIKFLTDDTQRKSKSATLSAVQAARAREIELRIAREENKLVDVEEAIGVLDEIVGGMKADFDGLAASITREPALRLTIEGKVDEIFRRHSNALKQKGNALRSGGTTIETDTEDDA